MDFESQQHHSGNNPPEHEHTGFMSSTHTTTPGLASDNVSQPAATTPQTQPTVSVWSEPAQNYGSASVVPPADTPTVPQGFSEATPTAPVPVVRVLSPVGVEYVFLTICLFAAATGLTWALLALVNGKVDFQVMAFPAALLLVSVPVFAFIFLHLKKLELRQPTLKLDPSKRRSTQFTQITSFLVSLFTLVGVIFSIFAKLGGQSGTSIGKILLDGLVLLVVFGGMLAYYWRDEHRG